ncbi:MAG TPA: alpha/beta hydrolase [Actinomycetota bacterium]|nr:alpha/beta hydrolase [Actinomycetota bacterium]
MEELRYGTIRGNPIGPVESFDGTELFVGEAGSGPTVVLVHGFCLNASSWHYQLQELSDEFRIVVYDMRGHGESERPESDDWSMEAHARDLAAVIDAVADGPVSVVGHSMGGMALIDYCGLFPEKIGSPVSAVALVDTAAHDVMGGMVPSAARLLTPALRLLEQAATMAAARNPEAFDRVRKNQKNMVALLIKLMGFGPKAHRHQLAFMTQMLEAIPAEILVPIVKTLRTMDVSRALDHIDVPTLVVVGSRDRLTPRAAARYLATAVHGARLEVIPHAGHMPMLEQPEAFNAVLRKFLRLPGASYGGRALFG